MNLSAHSKDLRGLKACTELLVGSTSQSRIRCATQEMEPSSACAHAEAAVAGDVRAASACSGRSARRLRRSACSGGRSGTKALVTGIESHGYLPSTPRSWHDSGHGAARFQAAETLRR